MTPLQKTSRSTGVQRRIAILWHQVHCVDRETAPPPRSPAPSSTRFRQMNVNDLVLVQGLRDTRETLDSWSRHGWSVIGRWFAGSAAIAATLLITVYVIGHLTPPDPSRFSVIGVNREG